MNLFDVKDDILDGIEYMEEILESNINFTKKQDKSIYTPLLFQKLKTDGFTDEDLKNSTLIICFTALNTSELSKFLSNFFRKFTLKDIESLFYITFPERRDASTCLYLSNQDFSFFRPKSYIETPDSPDVKVTGSKYCKNVPISKNKILLGPLDVEASILRDGLDEISHLQSFRECANSKYFVFTFQDSTISDAFIKATGHIFILDCNQPLISERAYKNSLILNLTKSTPKLAPRQMAGPIILSKEKTRIVTLLNVIGPSDTNTEEIVENIRIQSLNYGKIKNMVVPGLSTSEVVRLQGNFKIFIEAEDLETSQCIYDGFGGLIFGSRIIATGYYPELNYLAGEYE